MAEKKQSLIALLDILVTYSDEEHILNAKQLQDLMQKKYNITVERRTIYSNIEMLEQNGYVISKFEDNGKGYYLEERQFEKGEILLLCNAIHASHFISEKQSNELIGKLLKTLSKYQTNEFIDSVYMPNTQKTPNKELMYNISLISEAIRDKKEIKFTYMKYDQNKKMVPRRKEPYIVEPRYIVYADSRAYMIVTSKHHPGQFIHYRIDRISRAVILNESVNPLRENQDAYEYARNKLFMYTGEMQRVTFRCKERIIDQIIDIFGTELFMYPQNDYYVFNVSTSKTGAKFLAQQFLDSLEILQPESLRKEFTEDLKKAVAAYEQ